MTCETTRYGIPCYREAKWIVKGETVKEHPTCDECKEEWMDGSKDFPVVARLIETIEVQNECSF